MISCNLNKVSRVLCVGAHSDDIEIGCGGTLLQLTQNSPGIEFHWLVLASNPVRAIEAENSADAFLKNAGQRTVSIQSFPDGFLPYSGREVKECFEALKRSFEPDLIFTHYRHDLHQDHRFLCELTWNTFRNHLILEYEIPKYDADLGTPNFFVPLPASVCDQKISMLLRHFGSQRNKQWFDADLFRGHLRLRGVEAASPTRFAEGFHCRKLLLA